MKQITGSYYIPSTVARSYMCVRGRMGDNVFSVCTIPAINVVAFFSPDRAQVITDFPQQPNEKLVQQELTSALVRDENHFFRPIILAVQGLIFESIRSEQMVLALRQTGNEVGLIHIPDHPKFTVLEGMPQLRAIQQAIAQGISYQGIFRSPDDYEHMAQILPDTISMLFVHEDDPTKLADITAQLQRQVPGGTRSNTILNSVDNSISIVSQRLVAAGGILDSVTPGRELVNLKNTALPERSKRLFTLSAVQDINTLILEHTGYTADIALQRVQVPKDKIDSAYEVVTQYWSWFLREIEPYHDAVTERSRIPELRASTSLYTLLFKTPFQIGLFEGLLKAEQESGISFVDLTRRVTELDWGSSSPMWRSIVTIRNGQPIINSSRKAQQTVATEVAHHFSSQPNVASSEPRATGAARRTAHILLSSDDDLNQR